MTKGQLLNTQLMRWWASKLFFLTLTETYFLWSLMSQKFHFATYVNIYTRNIQEKYSG